VLAETFKGVSHKIRKPGSDIRESPCLLGHVTSVVDPKLFFPDPDPTLTLISVPDPDSDLDSNPDWACL
jgi:hypothetical protein